MGTLDFDLKGVVALAEEAGRATLTCYQKPLEIRYKGDESPVSQADELSHQIIAKGLADTGLQVVSEEGQTQSKATRYWCVDPLDGTKSFIAGVEDFTVNIALIVEGRPVWGVVVAPVLEVAWFGGLEGGSWRKAQGQTQKIQCTPPQAPLRVLASRNHLNDATQDFIETLGAVERVQRGSSLKFCAIAEGQADLYPRLGPCCEWDTAAGEAVLIGAGGSICDFQGRPLAYGKADVLNPHFLASGQTDPRHYLP